VGGRLERGDASDSAAEAAGLAHWRTGGRPAIRRNFAEQQRPATANPLDMIARGPASASRDMRGHGAPAPDILDSTGRARVHQVWPPGRPSESAHYAVRPGAAHLLKQNLSRGVPGAGADTMGDVLAYALPALPPPPPPRYEERQPRPSKVAFVTHSRGADFARNRARINATSDELLAPPLYEVRPGTAPARMGAAPRMSEMQQQYQRRPAWV
jgi:hypothetical protein